MKSILSAFLLAMLSGAAVSGAMQSKVSDPIWKTSAPRPRFEQLMVEKTSDSLDTRLARFEVWHDKESGQEVICAAPISTLSSEYKVSCWPTGRNWK